MIVEKLPNAHHTDELLTTVGGNEYTEYVLKNLGMAIIDDTLLT